MENSKGKQHKVIPVMSEPNIVARKPEILTDGWSWRFEDSEYGKNLKVKDPKLYKQILDRRKWKNKDKQDLEDAKKNRAEERQRKKQEREEKKKADMEKKKKAKEENLKKKKERKRKREISSSSEEWHASDHSSCVKHWSLHPRSSYYRESHLSLGS
ncbi:hypothetical protein GE061_007184 [Apolygus lucorum]|uniref:Uncharacterized protein n=1 Tax=Apolygus lucorum TaxID=248454 RepID=A0A8S9WSH8_APOLU|nr:hypothetical protein GE061_007184 [Apolygus lucorum]